MISTNKKIFLFAILTFSIPGFCAPPPDWLGLFDRIKKEYILNETLENGEDGGSTIQTYYNNKFDKLRHKISNNEISDISKCKDRAKESEGCIIDYLKVTFPNFFDWDSKFDLYRDKYIKDIIYTNWSHLLPKCKKFSKLKNTYEECIKTNKETINFQINKFKIEEQNKIKNLKEKFLSKCTKDYSNARLCFNNLATKAFSGSMELSDSQDIKGNSAEGK